MPWKERTSVDERVRFIGALSSCEYTMTELCRIHGISRKTGYKWAQRYQWEGLQGLLDRSRQPHGSPYRTSQRCERALVRERQQHPHWGPKKLLARLRRLKPDWPWPAPSTAGRILKRHGLIEPRQRRRSRPPATKPLVEATRANELWTVDFKGEFRLGDRTVCYPLTVLDHASRYLLACEGRRSTSGAGVREVFEDLFAQQGLPAAVLTDGGSPFAVSRSVRRLSRLSVWWNQLGITTFLTQPGHPEQNGRHERMHRTMKAETARPPAPCWASQQLTFDRFRCQYNHDRPHEALGMKTPSELYVPSARRYVTPTPEITYPGHYELRRVRSDGQIKWHGRFLFVGEALYHQTVGLEETDDRTWSLYLGSLLLGRYDGPSHHLDLL